MATEATPTPTESRVGRPEAKVLRLLMITIGKPRITSKGHSIGTRKRVLGQMLDHQKTYQTELKTAEICSQNKATSRLDLEREVDKTERLQMRIERLTTYFALPFWNAKFLDFELENKSSHFIL